MDNKFTIEDLEMIYLTEYDEDELEEDTWEEVLNFLSWLRDNYDK